MTTLATGTVVYLLAELRMGRGPVHAIGSRARVLGADGDLLTLAVSCGSGEEIVPCLRDRVARGERSLVARRRLLRAGRPARPL